MARKDVLKGLMTAATTPVEVPSAPSRLDRGAIGAVSRSFADLKARSVVEIDPGLIDAGGMADRLESDAESDATLRQSIADHGQQVPVLVRPHQPAQKVLACHSAPPSHLPQAFWIRPSISAFTAFRLSSARS